MAKVKCSKCRRWCQSRRKPRRCRKCWLKWARAHPEHWSFWKGGKIRSKVGYVWVLNYTHPRRNKRCNRIAEHRLVLEAKLGRLLKKGECVHHLNGVKDDNRPENLVLTTAWQHMHQYHRIATHCKMCGKQGQMRRGYCLKHYTRWFEAGFRGAGPKPDKPKRKCRLCGAPYLAKGLCERHYRAARSRKARVRR